MQARSEDQRELSDAESVVGHLIKPGSVFALLAEHRKMLFPDELFTDMFPLDPPAPRSLRMYGGVIVLQTMYGAAVEGNLGRISSNPVRQVSTRS